MKKIFVLLFISAVGVSGLLMNMACNATAPSSPNLQSPVQTIAAINPTFTFTSTPTFTPIFTPVPTATPYLSGVTWTGFSTPSAIVVDGSGNVYVADTGNSVVKKFASNGLLVTTWGDGGLKGKVAYTSPLALAVDSNKNLYVAGNGNQITKYDPSGNLISSSFSTVSLSGPLGLAVDPSDDLYISDAGNQQVVELTSAGSSVTTYPAGVSMQGIAVDTSGDVFVVVGNTVHEYTGGSLVLTIPGFLNPTGLTVDSSNNLWVADTGSVSKNIEEFPAGAYAQVPLAVFNGGGLLNSPKGVAVSPSGIIYVVDAGANDVVLFTK